MLELARRDVREVEFLKDVEPRIGIGAGVIDIKTTVVETPDEIARRLEKIEQTLGENRVHYAHPDCGFWMLPRSVADRKMRALVQGRDLYLGR